MTGPKNFRWRARLLLNPLLILMLALAAPALAPARAAATLLEVAAQGRDAETAALNARVEAVRQRMLALVGRDFVLAHEQEIWGQIILRAADFVKEATIGDSRLENGLVKVQASVEVDDFKLEDVLIALGAPLTGSREKERQREAARRNFEAVFGEEVAFDLVSSPIDLPAAAPDFEHPDHRFLATPASLETNQIFHFAYRTATPEGLKDPDGLILLLVAGTEEMPLGEVRNKALNEWRTRDELGMFLISANWLPPSDGRYELRMYTSRDKEALPVARRSFEARRPGHAPWPEMRLGRSVYAPREMMKLRLDQAWTYDRQPHVLLHRIEDDSPCPALREARSNSLMNYQVSHHRKTATLMGLDAPEKPGDYRLCFYAAWHDDSQPQARLDFKVRALKELDQPVLAVEPEFWSGMEPTVIVGLKPGWAEGASLTLSRSGREDLVEQTGLDVQKNSRAIVLRTQLLEPGAYELNLFDRDDQQAPPILTAPLAVKAVNLPQPPSLELASDRVWPGDAVHGTVLAKMEWPAAAWIGLVPAGTPEGAAEARTATTSVHSVSPYRREVGNSVSFYPQEPGRYEMRVYLGLEPDLPPLLRQSVTVMSEEEAADLDRQAARQAEAILALPPVEQEEIAIDEATFRRLIRVPKATPVTHQLKDVETSGRDIRLASARVPCRLKTEPATVSDAWAPGRGSFQVAQFQAADCKQYLDEEIKTMAKVDLTLGRDARLGDALMEMGMTFLAKWPVPDNSKAKVLRETVEMALDNFQYTTALAESISEGDLLNIIGNTSGLVLKNLLSACSDPECFDSVRQSARDMLRDYCQGGAQASCGQLVEDMRQALGNSDKTVHMMETIYAQLNDGMTVDWGQAAAEGWTANDFSAMTWTLGSGIVSTTPAGAMVLAAGKAAYQTSLAVRDWVVDDRTLALYESYRAFMAEGRQDKDSYNVFAMRDQMSISKARQMMLANYHNPLVRQAMSPETRRLGPDLKPEQIPNEEAEKYLLSQFEQWHKAEKQAADFAALAEKVREEYDNNKCAADFYAHRKKTEPKEQRGYLDTAAHGFGLMWDRVWHKNCPAEIENFKAYVKMRQDINTELLKWKGGSQKCSVGDVRARSDFLLCRLVSGGEEAYLDEVILLSKECQFALGEPKLYDRELKQKLEAYTPEAAVREPAIIHAMTTTGDEEILRCLCKHNSTAAFGVGVNYSPKTADSSCGGVGPCIAVGAGGCWRFHLATTDKALRSCGYGEAINKWRKERAASSSGGGAAARP